MNTWLPRIICTKAVQIIEYSEGTRPLGLCSWIGEALSSRAADMATEEFGKPRACHHVKVLYLKANILRNLCTRKVEGGNGINAERRIRGAPL
jgi:hypothetical protein